jgi:hypothetical protein
MISMFPTSYTFGSNKTSLGRSSGKGAFSIWTHNMKGIEWHDSFVPLGAPDTDSVPAVTLQAGEQWSGGYHP